MDDKEQEHSEKKLCGYCGKPHETQKQYDDCQYRTRMIRLIASLGC